MLGDLRRRPRTARELQDTYGTRYISLLRKLRMKGVPIWRRRTGSSVYYSLGEEDREVAP